MTVAELSEFLAEKLLVFNPDKFPDEDYKKVENLFKKLCIKPIDSIYNEIGTKHPKEVSLEKIKTLKKQLDDVFFEKLRLSKDEKIEIYKSIIDLLSSRVIKSKSI